MRVVVAEDSVLFREGLVRLLEDGGHEVVAAVGDGEALVEEVAARTPDIVVVDVRMPPTMTDEGLRAVHALRAADPHQPVLLLSQHIETRLLSDLVGTEAFGYLLKDRVLRVDDFLDAVRRVGAGGSALDPVVVGALVATPRADDRLGELTGRELEVLERLAQGLSNAAIAEGLVVTERTVEAHVRSIFTKLGLLESGSTHRRVLAVLAYLTR